MSLLAMTWAALGAPRVVLAQTTSGPARADDVSAMSSMPGMTMQDNAAQSMVLLNQLEAFHSSGASGQSWEAEGWYGTDTDRLWVRTEGNRESGGLDDADVEALWSHAVSAFWNTQLGMRQDVGNVGHRTWAALGLEGLAPYWFDVEATAYASTSGNVAARLRVEYEALFTQRWILQPEFETNLYSRSDSRDDVNSSVSDMQLGLRLRYNVTRQFAPYIGVVWMHYLDDEASPIGRRERAFDTQLVVGLRTWF
jgi:copper resistance protein B